MVPLCATPHRITPETPNYLMLGRETKLLPRDLLIPQAESPDMAVDVYALKLQRSLEVVGDMFRNPQQLPPRADQSEEPSRFQIGDEVWLKSFYKATVLEF